MRNPSTTPCCSKVGLKRGPWTPEEDELLSTYIKKEGEGRWRTLPKRAGLLRCGKSCRLRWMNYLRPSVKRGQIAPDEEDLILRLHRLLGNRWSLIAGRIPGRTDNEIKNYWNTHLSKKLISQGIDPRTHKPLTNITSQALHSSSSPAVGQADINIKAASPPSKANNIRNPNPNLLISSGLEEDNGGTRMMMITTTSLNKENISGFFHNNTSLDDDHDHGNTSLLNRAGGLMISNEDDHDLDDHVDINCCTTDDLFSSFLNSLINEDALASQSQPLMPSAGNIVDHHHHQPSLVSITSSTFGLGPSWESPIMSSSFNQNDLIKRVNNDNVA
ncbi:hypothetical protein EZV62_001633 [Acer yangbiense]|uniref:Uncharacterized protein n=1 Tax=Acer yangbiense TaxID=1000413 RepID=A0A5C7IW05_9ROSI|nr:hypothetical protein EZV62_001633 [Acer yangbiense]